MEPRRINTQPTYQTDGSSVKGSESGANCDLADCDSCSNSESGEGFEGISPEQVKRMMEEMKYLAGAIQNGNDVLAVETYVAWGTSRARSIGTRPC